MEEFTQITLSEWMEWKEDIRRKLRETAGNFVHIGFRLRQIRDSGMYDGCEDVFEFAQKEYGLGKSTVSRFIAINEKFSEEGYSIELRKEYKAIGSSKLSEMLTLTDAECSLITERTTVKEIRELKNFRRQQEPERAQTQNEAAYTPLQKCIIDYFSVPERREILNQTMEILDTAWLGETEESICSRLKEAAVTVNPGEYATHKKGIVFLFMYDWNAGVKYKLLTEPEPIALTWTEFLGSIQDIFLDCQGPDTWLNFYGFEEEKKAAPIEENQGFLCSVATSQQETNPESEQQEVMEEKQEIEDEQKSEEKAEIEEATGEPERECNGSEPSGGADPGAAAEICQADRDLPTVIETGGQQDDQIPGQDNVMNHPEYLPADMQQETEEQRKPEAADESELSHREKAEELVEGMRHFFREWEGQEIPSDELRKTKENAERLLKEIEQMLCQ